MVVIFDRKHPSLSQMYRNVECQHHLVQEKNDARPDIPGLTPVGFERWATLLIQAHPEEEFERLQKAILKMPISNPDDKKERFPKEISRRLFPDQEDRQTRRRIQDSMAERLAVGNHRRESQEKITAQPPPPSDKANIIENPRVPQNRRRSVRFAETPIISTSIPTQVPSHFECARHSPSISDSAIDDTPSPPPSPPSHSVARERKCDAAPPGGIERFQAGFGRFKPRSESFTDPALRLGRINSTSAAHPKPLNTNTRRRAEGPQPATQFDYGAANGANRHHGGPSSYRPSTNHFRRSDGDARGYEQTL